MQVQKQEQNKIEEFRYAECFTIMKHDLFLILKKIINHFLTMTIEINQAEYFQ